MFCVLSKVTASFAMLIVPTASVANPIVPAMLSMASDASRFTTSGEPVPAEYRPSSVPTD